MEIDAVQMLKVPRFEEILIFFINELNNSLFALPDTTYYYVGIFPPQTKLPDR